MNKSGPCSKSIFSETVKAFDLNPRLRARPKCWLYSAKMPIRPVSPIRPANAIGDRHNFKPSVSHCHQVSRTVTRSLTLSPGLSHCQKVIHIVTRSLALSPGLLYCHQGCHTVTRAFALSKGLLQCHQVSTTVTRSHALLPGL